LVRSLLLSFAAVAVVSCDRRNASRPTDSASDSAAGAGTTSGPNDWSSELGPLLLVPSDRDNAAVVLFPEAPSAQLAASAPVTLLSANGDTAVTHVESLVPDSVECGDAPLVRFSGSVAPTWSVGLLPRAARSLRMDSIEALPPADSARLAADLARLASALPMHRNSRFSGLPFAVLAARRFDVDGRQVVVAQLVRRLNQEAAPLEERTLVIAERPTGSVKREPYVVTHSRRSEGSEDTVEHFEVLAAIRGRQWPMLLVSRDQVSRTTYELLERAEDGWRVRWSRTLSC
jgi:hypothetical protein